MIPTEAKEWMERYRKSMVGGLNTMAIGTIERFDPVKMQADVALYHNGSLLVNIPVASIQTADFYIRVPYKKGDGVIVGFSQRDIDAIIHGDSATPTERMLDENDAMVLFGVNTFGKSLPAADGNKLVIAEKSGASKITMGGGVIDFVGNVKVNGTSLTPGGDNF